MIYSMTGFGKAEKQTDARRITVEIKSVNHRYLECGIKAPKIFSSFESRIRNKIKEFAVRGKVDVFVTYDEFSAERVSLHLNEDVADQYVQAARQLEKKFGLRNDFSVTQLMRSPDVLVAEVMPADEDTLWSDLEETLTGALQNLRDMRHQEGEHLRNDLYLKLDDLQQNLQGVIERAPGIIEEYKAKLKEKTAELLDNAQLDESRIAAEVILFADKVSTDEETVRLQSHITNMRKTLEQGGEIGRKLDFLAQEMNREANTILSKSNDRETSEIAVELKTQIEKIREQVQNVE